MIKNKKGSVWILVLIILVLIILGLVIYFILTGGDSSPIISNGNYIPRPPALPT